MEQAIAVRFYENKRYGTTFGKGMYRRALFNATADLQHPKAKYLLDLYNYADWKNTARTDDDMTALAMAEEVVGKRETTDLLGTWIKRLDTDNSKPSVFGFAILDLNTSQLSLLINDSQTDIQQVWQLEAKPCKQSTQYKNAPQLLATNTDLS